MTKEIKSSIEKTNELKRQIEKLEFECNELKVKSSANTNSIQQEKQLKEENLELKKSIKQLETQLKI